MKKTIRILSIINIICWLGAIIVAILRPNVDYRLHFIIAASVLVLIYGIEVAFGGELNDGQANETNTKQRRESKSDN